MSIEIYWFAYDWKTIKYRKLNFGYNVTIVKNVMYGHFGDLKSRDRDLVTLKPTKNGNFCLKNKYIHSLTVKL